MQYLSIYYHSETMPQTLRFVLYKILNKTLDILHKNSKSFQGIWVFWLNWFWPKLKFIQLDSKAGLFIWENYQSQFFFLEIAYNGWAPGPWCSNNKEHVITSEPLTLQMSHTSTYRISSLIKLSWYGHYIHITSSLIILYQYTQPCSHFHRFGDNNY